MARRLSSLLTFLTIAACGRAPSQSEALAILKTTRPALDTTTTIVNVWQDGPPWFSCNEVIAKFRSRDDSTVVRKQVGNWRSLVVADWVTLRDTSSGAVVDPGWCAASLRDSTSRLAGGWSRMFGDSLPSGSLRRGWRVSAGRQRIVVKDAPRDIGRDSAMVDYLLTVAPNANGVALGAGKDSVRQQALLTREDGKWIVAKWK